MQEAWIGRERTAQPFRSLWADTAIAAPELHTLEGNYTCDVAVIGAGFTGLVAALTLAEQGLRVVVVDAANPGWGASGRNNGQVIPGLKLDPDEVVAALGSALGEPLIQWAGAATDFVFGLIERLKIDCVPVRRGWIQPAYTRRSHALVADRSRQWNARGADTRVLEREELQALLGTSVFDSGMLDPRGGSIQPLSYTRGLAIAALAAGSSIFAYSSVQRLTGKPGTWLLATENGTVAAEHVIIATGAYGDSLIPGLDTAFIPIRTAQVASRPLPAETLATILPHRHVASDTRRLLTSFRISPDGRLVMGGASATGGAHKDALARHLHVAAAEIFGHLPPISWDYCWSGYLALTNDHLPHIHQPRETLHVGLGCNGRGIAVSSGMGHMLARRILGAKAQDLPIVTTAMRHYPFHSFRNLGIAAATAFKRLQDRSDRRKSAP